MEDKDTQSKLIVHNQPGESEVIFAYVTVPNEEVADKISSSLVDKKIAACVNIIPGIKSVYMWQGKVEKDQEILLMIKTRKTLFTELVTEFKSLHPYEVPEVISAEVNLAFKGYYDWVLKETKQVNQRQILQIILIEKIKEEEERRLKQKRKGSKNKSAQMNEAHLRSSQKLKSIHSVSQISNFNPQLANSQKISINKNSIFEKLNKSLTESSLMKTLPQKNGSKAVLPVEPTQEIPQYRNFPFKPQICKNSEKILGEKKRNQSCELFKNLYQQHFAKAQKQRKLEMQKKLNQEMIDKEKCTFSPNISQSQKSFSPAPRRKPSNYYQYSQSWAKKIQQKLTKSKASQAKKHPFQPQLVEQPKETQNKSLTECSKGIEKFLERQLDAMQNRLELSQMLEQMGVSKGLRNKNMAFYKQTAQNEFIKKIDANMSFSEAKLTLREALQSIDISMESLYQR